MKDNVYGVCVWIQKRASYLTEVRNGCKWRHLMTSWDSGWSKRKVERGRAITCPTDLVIVVGPQNSVIQHLLKPFLKLTLLICIKGKNDVSISIEWQCPPMSWSAICSSAQPPNKWLLRLKRIGSLMDFENSEGMKDGKEPHITKMRWKSFGPVVVMAV